MTKRQRVSVHVALRSAENLSTDDGFLIYAQPGTLFSSRCFCKRFSKHTIANVTRSASVAEDNILAFRRRSEVGFTLGVSAGDVQFQFPPTGSNTLEDRSVESNKSNLQRLMTLHRVNNK